ncbi:glycoside hydrolase family 7 protein [Gymnopus androsaceus JB14]|uniref:Glucanase n=1 Tax=Gymnopus androsaceus JB14 TaxID=1447944 RepID=A0A6A4IIC3_9AGAR|nr:glycoside hydrolase family 7 protein [Gymnopus androsaceus JB14]KAE9409433.1 glycoside hydrolase family 7 protein [Gymnopus androsaceus JB14]
MFRSAALISFAFFAVAYGQQIGTLTPEVHPPLTWETCTASGCTTVDGSVVVDANWRYLHQVGSTTNCYEGNEWDFSICTSPTVCTEECALDGADYEETYGVTTTGDSLTLGYVTVSEQKNVGSRLYLMAAGSETEYEIFKLVNQEFTFTVDVSNLPCGINGALYFSQMDADGGVARFPTNKAGAQYGTGYCDSQCPQDIKFIDGVANIVDWTPNPQDPNDNSGTGSMGTCCVEMDIWEANSMSTALTAHSCTVTEQTSCTGTDCSAANATTGFCDQAGCDFNPFRLGVTDFYGPGMTVDTTQPFTVVTQFISSNNESTGTLSSINRLYVQNGNIIQNVNTNVAGITATNAISTEFCEQETTAFAETDTFDEKGGLAAMGEAFNTGMVLVMSIWDDTAVNMLWLDSDFPVGGTAPGDARGSCAVTSGDSATTEAESPNSNVIFSNIKFGAIGSTFSATGTTGTGTGTSTGTGTAPAATQTVFGQCGGIGWTGPTVCAAGSTCEVNNAYFSQCLA